MTNREKYAEQILDVACSGSSVGIDKRDMTPTGCRNLNCSYCYFYDFKTKSYETCSDMRKEWWNEEYVEPPFDWSKVPVDTPILVRNSEKNSWNNRYFAKYENNRVYAWCGGATSWSAENNYASTTDWGYGKLAEESE